MLIFKFILVLCIIPLINLQQVSLHHIYAFWDEITLKYSRWWEMERSNCSNTINIFRKKNTTQILCDWKIIFFAANGMEFICDVIWIFYIEIINLSSSTMKCNKRICGYFRRKNLISANKVESICTAKELIILKKEKTFLAFYKNCCQNLKSSLLNSHV